MSPWWGRDGHEMGGEAACKARGSCPLEVHSRRHFRGWPQGERLPGPHGAALEGGGQGECAHLPAGMRQQLLPSSRYGP